MKSQTLFARSAVAAWAALVAAGFAAWDRYDRTPGAAGTAPPHGRGPGVTAYLHPHCPCSRATVSELAALADGAGSGAVTVVFVLPPGTEPGWERGPALDAAGRLGLAVRCDAGGAEALADGAATSGHVVARDAAGRVAFAGGVTPARGRAGACPGRSAVAAVLAGGEPPVPDAPVFGCPLFSPACEREGPCRP
ncbi:RedB protein [Gemmata sp.]|uniref:RedB protein n=1 Tax=Gemmata sp. TaxID=1914242 RepID=UPI003F72C88C